MKMKLTVSMLCCVFSLAAFAQDVRIPNFIEVTKNTDGSHTYKHVKLMIQGQYVWKDKNTGAVISLTLQPSVNRNVEGKYSVRILLHGTFPLGLGAATELKSIQLRTGHTVFSIDFDPVAEPGESEPSVYYGKSRIGEVEYSSGWMKNDANIVHVTFLEEDAIRLMEMIAYQSEEDIVTIRYDTNEGSFTMDTPLSVSQPLHEFYEWARDVWLSGRFSASS